MPYQLTSSHLTSSVNKTTYIKVLDMVINVWIKKVAKGKLYIFKQDFASFQRVQEFSGQ